MFQGQFDLEDQRQGHQFSNFSEIFMWSIHGSSLKVKFKTIQKLSLVLAWSRDIWGELFRYPVHEKNYQN